MPLNDELAFLLATFYLTHCCCFLSHLSKDILKNMQNRKDTEIMCRMSPLYAQNKYISIRQLTDFL